ncbi:MAG: MoxR family ATPase [Chlorobi bacterium]|nr:MoxR family ATPase [Chlorobiota bacterium]
MDSEKNRQPLEPEPRLPLEPVKEKLDRVREEAARVIVGQRALIDDLLAVLLAGGHALIEGMPGVAKTLAAKVLAKTIRADFSRIQFTPDLMPADILGTSVFNPEKATFEFKPGPIFSQIILIDEINRAPAKTQAALFEVMEERQVTVDGHTYPMEEPFLVLATQNPVEHEGTYRLPEAQLDRFMFKIQVPYPTPEEETAILDLHHRHRLDELTADITPLLTPEDIRTYRDLVRRVRISPEVMRYIAEIVTATRRHPFLFLGASPRASVALMGAAKAYALMEGRDFVTPDDVKRNARSVLGHRIIVKPEKEMEGIDAAAVVDQIIEHVEVPR